SYRRVVSGVARIEKHLQKHKWVAGSEYSLADIDLVNFTGYISYWPPQWIVELTNETTTPATWDWLNRFKERPAVKTMLSKVVRPAAPPGRAWLAQNNSQQQSQPRAN
ncbi:MAG: glutathione binding-like protein, partial [Alphaproteobacteria bacterium]